MSAALDRMEILRQLSDSTDPGAISEMARLAALDLAQAGAPEAAAALVERYPAALAGEAGAALKRRIDGDLAARHIRWGSAEPVFDPAQLYHEGKAAIEQLEAMRKADPGDLRSAEDLLQAYHQVGRMKDVLTLWETVVRRDGVSSWLRSDAADAYLSLHRAAEARELYRAVAAERPASPEPWLGLFWVGIEARRLHDSEAALDELAKIPGQELTAEIQRAWLLMFSNRAAAGQERFEALLDRYPGNTRVREGLATAYLWQGWPRRGLRSVEELLARTTLDLPRVDNPQARLARAGALSALGDLGEARRQVDDLVALYPENVQARRLYREIHAQLAPEVRLSGAYDTSDRGFGQSWSQLELSVPVGTRTRIAAGAFATLSDDDNFSEGDLRDAYLALAVRPDHWLRLSSEMELDAGGGGGGSARRDPSMSARVALLPNDRWRFDAGASWDAWRDLPLRARVAGVLADSYDAGFSYTAGPAWDARLGYGYSRLTDGNVRSYALTSAHRQLWQGPVYHGVAGVEVYASENSSSDVVYFSPRKDHSVSLTHRAEWVAASGGRRFTLSLMTYAGLYGQEGEDSGPVGGAWLSSDWDLSGRTVILMEAGARSQLYDGSRELLPRFSLTLRQRF
jgi:tetratricopeptide (TPR) repeat protein